MVEWLTRRSTRQLLGLPPAPDRKASKLTSGVNLERTRRGQTKKARGNKRIQETEKRA